MRGAQGSIRDDGVCLASSQTAPLLQDAHELFHVITSSLEDERDRQPQVTPLFDVHSLEVWQGAHSLRARRV